MSLILKIKEDLAQNLSYMEIYEKHEQEIESLAKEQSCPTGYIMACLMDELQSV